MVTNSHAAIPPLPPPPAVSKQLLCCRDRHERATHRSLTQSAVESECETDNRIAVLPDNVSTATTVAGVRAMKEVQAGPVCLSDSTHGVSILVRKANKKWRLVCLALSSFCKLRGHGRLTLLTCDYPVRNDFSLLLGNTGFSVAFSFPPAWH